MHLQCMVIYSASCFFSLVAGFDQDVGYTVAEVALDYDLAVFGRAAHAAFAFQFACKDLQVIVGTDETSHQSYLFACALLAVEPYA